MVHFKDQPATHRTRGAGDSYHLPIDPVHASYRPYYHGLSTERLKQIAGLTKAGYLASVQYHQARTDEPLLHEVAFFVDPDSLPGCEDCLYTNQLSLGRDFSVEQAFLKAHYEFIERYSFLFHDEVATQYTDIADCTLANQYSHQYYRGRTGEIAVVEVVSLLDHTRSYVPTADVFMNYHAYQRRDAATHADPETNSSGCAVGQSKAAALNAALCELIERDALGLYWLLGLPAQRIDTESLPESLGVLVDTCRRYQLTPILLAPVTDHEVPVVFCVVLDESGVGPAVSFGSAAHARWDVAVEKSLVEALGARLRIRRSNSMSTPAVDLPESTRRLQYWALPAHRAEIDFLLTGEMVPFASLSTNLALVSETALQSELVARLAAAAQSDIMVYEAANELCQREDVYAQRVLCAGLQQFAVHQPLLPAAERIARFTKTLGLPVIATRNQRPLPLT